LNEVVDAALELLGYGLQTAGIDVQRDSAPSLPEIWADPDQISQVITNLIVNAQQALSDWAGPRRLTIITRFDAGDGMVRISVSDSGPAELRPRSPGGAARPGTETPAGASSHSFDLIHISARRFAGPPFGRPPSSSGSGSSGFEPKFTDLTTSP
jgi:hypothetical protein